MIDNLGTAFMALGVKSALNHYENQFGRPNLDSYNGFSGFMTEVMEHAEMLDVVGQYFDTAAETHPVCWLYEVAEVFGEKLAYQLLNWERPIPENILFKLMKTAGYSKEGLDAAFAQYWHRKRNQLRLEVVYDVESSDSLCPLRTSVTNLLMAQDHSPVSVAAI